MNTKRNSHSYNHLNLPTKIDFGDGEYIRYTYDASGIKLKKWVREKNDSGTLTESVTQYLGGYQYNNYVLQFFPHAEGYIQHKKDGNEHFYNYVYQYKDHLGNIRLNYSYDEVNHELKIMNEHHYYPFGLEHKYYNNAKKDFVVKTKSADQGGGKYVKIEMVANSGYMYKYNGKELQDELGLDWYDYGARNYDASIGRWMNVDPMSEMAYDLTPYRYSGNNPVLFKDHNGLWEFRYDEKTKKLSLNRQKGDTYDSFLEQSGLSQRKARKLFGVKKKELKTMLNEGGNDSFGVSEFNSKSKIGNMLQGMEEALTTGNDELSQNPTDELEQAINNCHNSTINLTTDGKVDSKKLNVYDPASMILNFNFDIALENSYTNVRKPNLGVAIRYSADGGETTTHGSVFLLQNKNGIQTFTKNGFSNYQLFSIMYKSEIIKTYGSIYGDIKGRQNYTTTQTDAKGITTTVTRSDSSPYYRKN